MEASTATRTTTRPKATPDFRVLMQAEDGRFELLTSVNPIKAANKKGAIREAAGEKEGTFLAIREKEYNPLTRRVGEVKTVVKTEETWS